MTESKPRHTPDGEPVVWLQHYETSGQADCGCYLDSDYAETGTPAFILCPLHARAHDLLAEVERLANHARNLSGILIESQNRASKYRSQLAELREAAQWVVDYGGLTDQNSISIRGVLGRIKGGE